MPTGQHKIIAVDFDGTLVDHVYPMIGDESPYAIKSCRYLVKEGCQLILWTMRSCNELAEAVSWCENNRIKLWAVNNNPTQK